MNGLVDDARIYNRALSAAEIQSLATGAQSSASASAPASAPTAAVASNGGGPIDLGKVKLGQKVSLPLEVPAEVANATRLTWKAADKSTLPPGAKVGRGMLTGKPKSAGTYTFSVHVSGKQKVTTAEGKSIVVSNADATFQLTVEP